MTGSDEPSQSDEPSPAYQEFKIRILADGSVVFIDLPSGLAEVAAVVAGEQSESIPGAEGEQELT